MNSGYAAEAGVSEVTGGVAEEVQSQFPAWAGATWTRSNVLRYGENPHQAAALYVSEGGEPGLAQAEQFHGKEMSYNNYQDADAAWRAAHDHSEPCVAIIKHANRVASRSPTTSLRLTAMRTNAIRSRHSVA